MNILTNQPTTEFELINNALSLLGLPTLKNESEFQRLGEGAWHHAYLVKIESEPVVIRLPKKVAYDKEVQFDAHALHAEYAGTQSYYKHANQAKKGICPQFFNYHVSEELTFTIESYVGSSLELGLQTNVASYRYGVELGEFFLAKEQIPSPVEGLGYLTWNCGKLIGQFDSDLQSFIAQETEEYEQELEELLASELQFDKKRVMQIGKELIPHRAITGEKPVFTNQDTSPENLIFREDGVNLIDPYPLIYTGVSLAANHVHNYKVLFPTFYNVPRYKKHEFHLFEENLLAIANGFIGGYTQGSIDNKQSLSVEVFLKLLTMTHGHYQLFQKDILDGEELIRYGTKAQIKERLTVFLKMLENYAI
ncbi:hypothetical protein [Alkalihalobacillus sp. AL-G]|uniref:hypothetical protein n=1 Tax=Alkalihalobacillus sp. AL-G TaxID=2926399 RepID=UPI002729550C|nr:hypothetical protein [Alkalihalobacillus sp. AL-G]WLD94222.1 hypothetical protein MOJ78_04845 [Alkalihalobacillus sp. AL-G]